jgi:DNA-binding GntR family transcriptional regulator
MDASQQILFTDPGITQASSLCDRLRTDLLEGKLKPGQKLQLKFLMEAYQVGQTPIREALNRLASEGLVALRDQRGFTVTGISIGELQELTKTRSWLEERALREAMKLGSAEWEEGVVLAWHRLSKTRRSLSDAGLDSNPEWERLHRLFHHQIIAGCGSRWLISYIDHQVDLLYRYRQLSARKAFPRRNLNEEHGAIVKAIVDGNSDHAVALLMAHFQASADVILADPTLFASE